MTATLYLGAGKSGFAAGTLVRIKEGLKPIEQVRVGDWALTQLERTGERTFRRVTGTTRFEDRQVWTVIYYPKSEWERAKAEGRTMPVGTSRRLMVTPDHPLWIRGRGWVSVKDIWALNRGQEFEGNESAWAEFGGYELELADGQSALLSEVFPLYRTETESVAWQEGMFDPDNGTLIDLRQAASGELAFRSCGAPRASQPLSVERWNESSYFRCEVYDLNVQECHTYYVGTLGVWTRTIDVDGSIGKRGEEHAP